MSELIESILHQMLNCLTIRCLPCQWAKGWPFQTLIGLMALLVTRPIVVAQTPTITRQKALGGSKYEYAIALTATPDNGYLVANNSYSTDGDVRGNHGYYDYWITKINQSGNLAWQKCLGGTDEELVQAVATTPDGGYVLAGTTKSKDGDVTINHGKVDCWIIKLDGSGNLIWQKSLGGSDNDYASAVRVTADGGYIVAGCSYSKDGDVTAQKGGGDYWVIKLDAAGTLVWQKSYGGRGMDFATALTEAADGGYVVGGMSYSNNGDATINRGGLDYWVVKLDEAGNLVWQKSLGGSGEERIYSLTATPDGGCVAVGYSFSMDGDVTANHGGSDYWVVKLDGSGSLLWQKSLGGSGDERAYAVALTSDGGYQVAGSTNSSDGDVTGYHGGTDYWVVKLSSTGALLWQRALGGSSYDEAYALLTTAEGASLVVGAASSTDGDVTVNHGLGDSWLVSLGAPPSSCYSLQSGDWASGATWSCGHEPSLTDIVILNPGHRVIVSTASARAKRLVYRGGLLNFTSSAGRLLLSGNDSDK